LLLITPLGEGLTMRLNLKWEQGRQWQVSTKGAPSLATVN